MTQKKMFMDNLNSLVVKEGWRPGQALRNFISAAFYALKKRVSTPDVADQCEEQYMKIVELCRYKESMTTIAHMMGSMTLCIQETMSDFMGPVFMELMADSHRGQFFTPDSVCDLMSELTLSGIKDTLHTQSHVWIDEPACGAGAMVLSACRYLVRSGHDHTTKAMFRLADLDQTAYMIAYIQMELAGVSAVINHQNTLTLELFDTTYTSHLLMNQSLLQSPHIKNEPEIKNSKPIQLAFDLGV